MKKEIFTLTFMLLLGANLFAQDLVFKMTEDSGVEIVNDARFDIVNKCIGNTKEGTTIRLGEVQVVLLKSLMRTRQWKVIWTFILVILIMAVF